MMSTEEDYWVWLESSKAFLKDPASVEEGKGEIQRTGVVLSAHYALANGANRQGQ